MLALLFAVPGLAPDATHDVKISGDDAGNITYERIPRAEEDASTPPAQPPALEGIALLYAQAVESAGRALTTYAEALHSQDARRIAAAEPPVNEALALMLRRGHELNTEISF